MSISIRVAVSMVRRPRLSVGLGAGVGLLGSAPPFFGPRGLGGVSSIRRSTSSRFSSSLSLGFSAMAFNPKNLTLVGINTTRRRLPRNLAETVAEAAGPLGKAIWAWNYCHSAFSRLFATLTSPSNAMLGFAIWHTLQNDSTQRAMVLAAARAALSKDQKALRRVEWAKRQADSLSTLRNDFAHMATAFQNPHKMSGLVPDHFSTAPTRYRRLSEIGDLNKLLKDLYGDLISLAGFVSMLDSHCRFPQAHSLPKKPALRSIPNPPLLAAQARKKPKPRRRPKPSPP